MAIYCGVYLKKCGKLGKMFSRGFIIKVVTPSGKEPKIVSAKL